MKKTVIAVFLTLLALAGGVQAQIASAQSGEWRQSTTWVGGVVPTSADDVIISAGHDVSVDDATSECRSLSFEDASATIDMNADGWLYIYGDFTIAGATHDAFSGWSTSNARIVFAGDVDQVISGFSTSGGSTSFRNLIIDKTSGTVSTSGTGMRLGIQASLDIISGELILAPDDDLEERWCSSANLTGNSGLDITVHADGAFSVVDGSGTHFIRSGTGSVPIGDMTIYGYVSLYDASSYDLSFSSVTIKDGGTFKLGTGLGSSSYGPELNSGPITVESGGEIYTVTTTDPWFVSDGTPEHPDASVDLQEGATFTIYASTAVLPPVFYNNGRCYYNRTSGDQDVYDIDYFRLELYGSTSTTRFKNWVLDGDRVVTDSLVNRNQAYSLLTASAPRTLTVGNTLRLVSGTVDASDGNVTLQVGDGCRISRATGQLAEAPAFLGSVNLRYTSSSTVTTDFEMPTDPSTLNELIVSGSGGLDLGADVQANGPVVLEDGPITTGASVLTLGSGATLDETAGFLVQGNVLAARTLAQSTSESFGNLGLEINAAGAAPGVTSVLRVTGTPQDLGGGVYGIARYWDISAANNGGLNATMVAGYDESELNGIPEEGLSFYTSEDGGTTWVEQGGTVDALNNTVSLAGVDDFSLWTLGLETTPPVCTVPANQDLLQCEPTEICLPVSCTDDHDPAPVMTIVSGPGALVGGDWCYTPANSASFTVTVRCDDAYGNYCESSFDVAVTINRTPQFTNCPDQTLTVAVGETFTLDLDATDPDPGQTISYSLGSGTPDGVSVNSEGVVTWPTNLDDICGGTLAVVATDDCGETASCEFDVCVSNTPPEFTTYPVEPIVVGWGEAVDLTLEAVDPDLLWYGPFYHLLEWPYSVPGPTIDANTGAFHWETGYDTDYSGVFEVSVEVSDGGTLCDPCAPSNADTVSFAIEVNAFALTISKEEDVFVGQPRVVTITMLDELYMQPLMGGFDFLIQYDNSAMIFQFAEEGGFLTDCEWEYFTYRFGPTGNCGAGACPSGIVRVVAMGETTGGNLAHHPTCDNGDAGTSEDLVYLHFLVGADANLECNFAPIRWIWYDCTDNSVSTLEGDSLLMSGTVWDFAGFDEYDQAIYNDVTGLDLTMPTLTGAPGPECDVYTEKGHPWRLVHFYNGGLDIICSDSIDAVGDINLNNIAHEIADAVMFTNYFIEGLSAFGDHVEGSIAASDVNRDGIALSVADLVYLIRVIVGDAQPYAKLDPVSAHVTYNAGTFGVTGEMGAALVVLAGDVTPTLLANNMDMMFGYNGTSTSVLVYSLEPNQSFTGDFLHVEGRVVSTEFATFYGQPVTAKVMPTSFTVSQNYPNPFNPTTKIDITVPNGGAWSLNIYNISGRLVKSYSGISQSGFETIEWDASDASSGVYLYKVSAGKNSLTKKAVLLK